MTRRSARLGVFAVVLVAAATAPALAASCAVPAQAAAPPVVQPGLGVRLLDAPTALANDPRALVYIVDRIAPGASITRHMQVTNGTGAEQQVSLYPDAATVTDSGFVAGAGRSTNQLTSWTTMTPSSLDLPNGGEATVTVTIKVPAAATPAESYGLLTAELTPRTSADGLQLVSRVGIRMYLSVGDGSAPASSFTVSTLTAMRLANGQPAVAATITNTGGRALDMRATLDLTRGPAGLRAGPFTVPAVRTVGIGDSAPVITPLDARTPAGPWLATLDLFSGEIHRHVQATITFPAKTNTSAIPVAARPVPAHRDSLLAIAGALILILLVALAVVLITTQRRRKGKMTR